MKLLRLYLSLLAVNFGLMIVEAKQRALMKIEVRLQDRIDKLRDRIDELEKEPGGPHSVVVDAHDESRHGTNGRD